MRICALLVKLWAKWSGVRGCAYMRAGRSRPIRGDCGCKEEVCVIAPTKEQAGQGPYEAIVGAKRRSVRLHPQKSRQAKAHTRQLWVQGCEKCDCTHTRANRARRVEGGCGCKEVVCVITPTKEQTGQGPHEASVGAKWIIMRLSPQYAETHCCHLTFSSVTSHYLSFFDMLICHITLFIISGGNYEVR